MYECYIKYRYFDVFSSAVAVLFVGIFFLIMLSNKIFITIEVNGLKANPLTRLVMIIPTAEINRNDKIKMIFYGKDFDMISDQLK